MSLTVCASLPLCVCVCVCARARACVCVWVWVCDLTNMPRCKVSILGFQTEVVADPASVKASLKTQCTSFPACVDACTHTRYTHTRTLTHTHTNY